MEVKKIHQFKLSSVWTLAGVSTGAEPEETKSCPGQRETDYTRQQRSLLLKREGRQPRPWSRLCGLLLLRGGKEEAGISSGWTEIPSLKAEG